MKIENRGYIFAILGPLSSILSALRLRSHGAFSGRQGRFVVWMVAYFFYVFDVSDGVTAIDHEDCAALDAKFLDLAAGVLPDAQARKVMDLCRGVETLPSAAEIGLPRWEVETWYALFAPRGTPKPIVDELNGHIQAMLRDPAHQKKFAESFYDPMPMSADTFAVRVKADAAKWERLVQETGIELQ